MDRRPRGGRASNHYYRRAFLSWYRRRPRRGLGLHRLPGTRPAREYGYLYDTRQVERYDPVVNLIVLMAVMVFLFVCSIPVLLVLKQLF